MGVTQRLSLKEARACRLTRSRLTQGMCDTPQRIVSYFGAIQSQEYAHAKWALGLRNDALTDRSVESAFQDGCILRTHVLRPTWHFVAPEDIRWMLKLTAPGILRLNRTYHRKFGLDDTEVDRSLRIIEKELPGTAATRTELAEKFDAAGIHAAGPKLAYIMMTAELKGLICSGPRRGKQFTYALLDEAAPLGPLTCGEGFTKDEALEALVDRYLASRAPATEYDLAVWSGLSVTEARRGIGLCGKRLIPVSIAYGSKGRGEETRAFLPDDGVSFDTRLLYSPSATFLMPDYDEYGIGYKDRRVLMSRHAPKTTDENARPHAFVIDGIVEGSWKLPRSHRAEDVEIDTFIKPNERQQRHLLRAKQRYLEFVSG